MKEAIIKLTSDRIKVKGGEYVQDLVRCRECRHREEYPCKVYHDDDWYCADGEREGE